MPTTTTEPSPIEALAPRRFRLIWKLTAALMVMIVISAVLGVALYRATEADRHSQAACQLYKSLAESAPAAATSALGLRIIADTRDAYVQAGCALGKLAPPDPRIVPYLSGR